MHLRFRIVGSSYLDLDLQTISTCVAHIHITSYVPAQYVSRFKSSRLTFNMNPNFTIQTSKVRHPYLESGLLIFCITAFPKLITSKFRFPQIWAIYRNPDLHHFH